MRSLRLTVSQLRRQHLLRILVKSANFSQGIRHTRLSKLLDYHQNRAVTLLAELACPRSQLTREEKQVIVKKIIAHIEKVTSVRRLLRAHRPLDQLQPASDLSAMLPEMIVEN